MTAHHQTHLYTYAVALIMGDLIRADNLEKTRAKAIRHGHTEGECQCVERDPQFYVTTGDFAPLKGN